MKSPITSFLKNSYLFRFVAVCMFATVSANVVRADSSEDIDYTPYPQPGSGYVSDHASLLTYAEEERIERWLWQVESRTNVEIIVVTIDSMKDFPETDNASIESFATALFDVYGIGNMPKNDGILLLVAKGDRKARIELGKAYGSMRNYDATRIMEDYIIPQFKQDDYAAGIANGTEAIILEFANMRVGFPWRIVWLVIGGIVSLLVGVSMLKSGKRGWGFVFIGLAIVLILLAIFILVRILQHMPNNDSSHWSSGGMGGFGGGSSGGGGATGSW